MKRKIVHIFMVLIILLYSFGPSFSYADQSAVCSSPSDEMAQYYQFQTDALTILMGGNIEEASIAKVAEQPWLFSEKALKSKSVSVLNKLVQNMRANATSLASAGITTTVLLMLSASQVIETSFQSIFGILWQDRYIVREYKKMLEIDDRIMSVAYYLSDKMLLTAKLDSGKIEEEWTNLLNNYMGEGKLFEKGVSNKMGELTIATLLQDLSELNGAMKGFMSFEGSANSILTNFKGCFGNREYDDYGNLNCDNSYYYKFNSGAVKNLVEDYKDRHFSSCSSSWRDFGKSISKAVDNNKQDVKDAVYEVKQAFCRLQGAFGFKGGEGCEEIQDGGKGRCNLSPYEMAQLRAYYGGGRTCNNRVIKINGMKVELSELLDNNLFTSIKKNLTRHKEKTLVYSKSMSKRMGAAKESYEDCYILEQDSDQASECWYSKYGNSSYFNIDYSKPLETEFMNVFEDVENQHRDSRMNAISVDIKDQLISIASMIVSVESVSQKTLGNSKIGAYQWIEKVCNYQCSN